MYFLSISFTLFLLLLMSTGSPSSVRYCDRIFQLLNRTDESEKTCKWYSPQIVEEHLPCNTSSGYGGLTCGGECVSFGDWCVKGTTNPTVCGYHLQNPVICRNKTFWEKQECPETSKGRCTGWWPGQCQGEDGCRDQSHQNNNNDNNKSTCLAGDKIINVTKEFITCPDKYNPELLVCAKECDRVFDGCQDDSDEKDCEPVISITTLGLVVVYLIVMTIICAETTIWAVNIKSNQCEEDHGHEDHEHEESTENESALQTALKRQGSNLMTLNVYIYGVERERKAHKWAWFGLQSCMEDTAVLREVVGHMDRLFDVILDPNNWVFGELQFATCSTFACPSWTTGEEIGFNNQKLQALQLLYNNFRKMIPNCKEFKVRKCECPRCMCFRFFLYAVPNKSPESPRKQFEKLPHYVFDLIYNTLEVEFLKEHVSNTDDTDISIKYALGNRESSAFYGNVSPYLHVPSLFLKLIHFNVLWFDDIERFIENIPHIRYITYFVGIILAIVFFYIDFIKDILIADYLSFLYTTFWDFKSQIVLLLWATVFVNQTIIGIMIVIRGPTKLFDFGVNALWKRRLIRFMFLLMSPLSPTLLLYMNVRVGMELLEIEKKLNKELHVFHPPKVYYTSMQNLKLYHDREHLVERKRKMESVLGTSYKIAVIYENTPQILVQVLIVLFSLSAVTLPDMSGIEAVFDTRNEDDNIGSLFFYFSIIWSLFMIIISLVSTFLYQKEYNVPDLGKVLIFLLMFISTSLRLICIILYVAPFLGLFSLLLHYQIDKNISYSQEVLDQMNQDSNYSPDLNWYLIMTQKEALIVFFFIPPIHAIIVLIYKSLFVEDFKIEKKSSYSFSTDSKRPPSYLLTIYNRCVHAFSSLLGPTLFRDWDIPIKTTREDYQKLWKVAMQEYLHMSILFFLENLILLVPVIYTCGRVQQRHNSLQFPLQEEEDVMRSCYWFLCSPLIVMVFSCLHFYLFIVYNTHGHPWSILLHDKIQEKGPLENVETVLKIK